MIKRLAGIAACAVILQAGTALAENRAETVTLAPYVGGASFLGNQHLETGPDFGFRLGYNLTDNWALEGVIDYASTEPTNGNANIGMLRYGGDLLYNFLPQSSFVPYLAAGFGGMNFNGGGMPTYTRAVYNYGGGLKWFMSDNVALRADVRGLNYSYHDLYTTIEYTLGLHIAVGAPKPAPKPIEPPPAPVEQPKAVAPTATLDAVPASVEKGKAVSLSWDSQNATDCDIQPGVGPVATKGSVQVIPVADTGYTLTCKGAGGTVASTANVGVTEPPAKVEESGNKAVAAGTRLTLQVQFDTGKSVIKRQYYNELKVVGDGLNEHKELKGTIEGYTDNVGGAKYNQRLSLRRAQAVREYIVKHFKVDAKRLAAKGYGESHPIADNATAAGRAQNRRVEAVFEEIPNFKADAAGKPAPAKKAVKKPAKKKVIKKK